MDEASLDALLSRQGQKLLSELTSIGLTPANELQVLRRLRPRYDPVMLSAAVELVLLRRKAALKFERAHEMYFTRSGLEQASSEMVSRYRSQRLAHLTTLADLCCGIGGDTIALAQHADVSAVDSNPLVLRMAALNAEVYGISGRTQNYRADVQQLDLKRFNGLWIDPARRRASRRVLDPERASPPLSWCFSLTERCESVGIKTAPGMDLLLVPEDWEVEFISVRGELREAVLWSPALRLNSRRATVLPGGNTLVPSAGDVVPCGPPGVYLYDPDPAVTRARAVETLARSLKAWKLDEHIAFLTSDRLSETPFARPLRIKESLPWGLKSLRAVLRSLNIGRIDIRKRGSPVDVDDVVRRLRLSGTGYATVVLTRLQGKPWTLVCEDV